MKLIELEEEEDQKLADMEATNMGEGDDNSNLYEEEESYVQEICEKKRPCRMWGGRSSSIR